MNFIQDPTLQFIATVFISILSLSASIWIYWRQRVRKEITYELSRDSNNWVTIKIFNSGNQYITADEYEDSTPIVFEFPELSRVIDAQVIDTKPQSIKRRVTLTKKTNSIEMKPLLLNSKDSIVLKVHLSQYSSLRNVDARIAGVSDIQERDRTKELLIQTLPVGAALIGGLSVVSLIAQITGNNVISNAISSFLEIIFGILILVWGVYFLYNDLPKLVRTHIRRRR